MKKQLVMDQNGDPHEINLSRSEAVKYYCYQCTGYSHSEVTLCPAEDCPLHPWRKGPPSALKALQN